MTSWRIELLGGLRAIRGDQVLRRFRSRKAGELLAYLAYYRERHHSREALADLLWSGDDPRAARQRLNIALSALRRQLEVTEVTPSAIFVADRDAVGLNPASVTTDLSDYLAELSAARRCRADTERAARLGAALALYTGELLPECAEEWVLQERRWLGEGYFAALGELLALLERDGEFERAVEYARRGITLDPLHEETHRDLIRLLAAGGQTGAALRHYEALERLLADQLGAAPEPASRALAREIERLALMRPLTPTAPQLGRRHGESRVDPAEERRLVTLLCLSPSPSRLSGGPPTGRHTERVFAAVVASVLKYEGRIETWAGERLLALFGAPRASEEDAERAIRAALEIQRALGLEWPVSAAIDTGEVTFRAAAESGQGAASIDGSAVERVADLHKLARPGQILVSEATHRLTRRAFVFAGVPAPRPSGFSHLYAVERALPRGEKPYGIPGLRTPLIGRDTEIATLHTALTGLAAGPGRIVCVIGEAGVGKSRLVSELRSHLSAPALWLEGRALGLTMTTSYSLFLDLLHAYFAWGPDDSDADRAARLVAELRQMTVRGALSKGEVEEIGPLLGHLLSLRFSTEWDQRLQNASPEQIRHRTFLAVRDLLLALAHRRPLVLVLEDLHWADRHSLDLITLLMEALPSAPIGLLCLYRPEREHASARLTESAARKAAGLSTELRLRELTPEQSGRLARSLLEAAKLPLAMESSVLETARGNPFFIEEIVRSLIDDGPSPRSSGRGRAPTEGAATVVPAGVQGVIRSRVDRLRPELQSLLRQAAVVGRFFRPRLLERLIEAGDLEAALWELEEQGLVYQERAVPETEYAFRHVLTQETVYASLSPDHQATLHERVAAAIEALDAERLAEQYEQLAYHYDRSHADEKAVEYLLKAGEKARRAYLNEAALGYFERALERLEGSPLRQERQEWRLEALKGLGKTCHVVGRVEEAERACREAIRVARAIGLPPREVISLFSLLADALWWQSRCDEMIRVGEEGLTLLGDDTESLAAALMNDTVAMGHADSPRGDPEKWRAFTSRNARFIDRLPYSEELRGPYTHIHHLYQYDRNLGEAVRWIDLLERKATDHHDLVALGEVNRFASDLAVRQGDLHEGLCRIRQALAGVRQIGDCKHEAICLNAMGDLYLSMGQLAAARECAKSLIEVAEAVGNPQGIVFGYQKLGTLLLCLGRLEPAEEAQQAAARCEQEMGRPSAWTAFCLGRACMVRGTPREARRHFWEAAARARQGTTLAAALGALEAADARTFRTFCHRSLKDAPPIENARLDQWLLQPTSVATVPHGALRDRFAPPLTDWVWHDPFGDSTCVTGDGVEIRALAGRDLQHMNRSAPRLLRRESLPAGAGFRVETHCLPATRTAPAVGGLLLWQDEQNLLQLERGRFGPHEICFLGCLGGSDRIFGRGRLASARLFLRLERSEGRVSAFCSPDGDHWFTVGHTLFPSTGSLRVGVHAIGETERAIHTGAHPDGTAIRFEEFTLWAS